MTKTASGEPAIVVGLSEENWRLLEDQPIMVDLETIGGAGSLVIFRAADTQGLVLKAVELGVVIEDDPRLEPRDR